MSIQASTISSRCSRQVRSHVDWSLAFSGYIDSISPQYHLITIKIYLYSLLPYNYPDPV